MFKLKHSLIVGSKSQLFRVNKTSLVMICYCKFSFQFTLVHVIVTVFFIFKTNFFVNFYNYYYFILNKDVKCSLFLAFQEGFTSLEDYVCFCWASPCRRTGIPKTAVMPDSGLWWPGKYVLVYITAKQSILGISQPFVIG